MARVLLPPQTEELIDENKFPALPWVSFFDGLASGDTGTIWNPTFVGLTSVGTPTITGIYYRLSSRLVYYRIVITPSTSTASTIGVTYCNNFPLSPISDGGVVSIVGAVADLSGSTFSDRRIYTATWPALATPVVVVGLMEVN